MRPFKVKKKSGGEHYKIFIRNKLSTPKAPLKLFTKVNFLPVEQEVDFENRGMSYLSICLSKCQVPLKFKHK